MRNIESRYTTPVTDLALTVTLLLQGFNLESMDSSNPARVIFRFTTKDNILEVMASYWKSELSVEPKSFCNLQRELKARIRTEGGAW